MSQSKMDLRSLGEFSAFLKKKGKEIGDRSSIARGTVKELKQEWSDARFQEFEKVFLTVSADLDEFLKAAKKYSDYLDRKVMLGEKYLRR